MATEPWWEDGSEETAAILQYIVDRMEPMTTYRQLTWGAFETLRDLIGPDDDESSAVYFLEAEIDRLRALLDKHDVHWDGFL